MMRRMLLFIQRKLVFSVAHTPQVICSSTHLNNVTDDDVKVNWETLRLKAELTETDEGLLVKNRFKMRKMSSFFSGPAISSPTLISSCLA
ncbi:hypothetical protein E2C01_007972 [Portunus trituberculatus]|uniref:Uncharacterized protein n=1 Tax=Portunus trituberculatus TaxID=210409 RepID=A0A5B7D0J9_PORTR|nr:hypothetical protein [Portunus trituberculatus]